MKVDHEIRRIKLSDFTPAGYNPRKISQEAKAGLKASLERFGVVEPLVVNKRTGRVVGGHQRMKVLLDEGIEEVDAVVVDLNESEEKALNIALNSERIGGEWDLDALGDLLDDLYEEMDLSTLQELRFDEMLAEIQVPDLAEISFDGKKSGGKSSRGGEHFDEDQAFFTVVCDIKDRAEMARKLREVCNGFIGAAVGAGR